MSDGDLNTKEFVLIKMQRNVVNLYKNYIVLAEELKREHDVFLKKIENQLPQEYINDIDYFDSERYNYLRKRILDMGNELNRDLEKYFDMINIELDKDSLNQQHSERLNKLLKNSKSSQVTSKEGKLKVKGKLI